MNWRQIAPNSLRRKGSPPERLRFSIGPELLGQLHDLVEGQIVALIELLPVEAVLALHVAERVDEQDQKRRARHIGHGQVLPIEARVLREPFGKVFHG